MKKQRRGLNRYNLQQDGIKAEKKFLYICIIDKKLNVKKTQEKKTTTKNGVNGILTHIHENRWLLVYKYIINERSTYCAIESLEYYT